MGGSWGGGGVRVAEGGGLVCLGFLSFGALWVGIGWVGLHMVRFAWRFGYLEIGVDTEFFGHFHLFRHC